MEKLEVDLARLEQKLNSYMISNEKALELAKEVLNLRLDKMNEFREQMDEDAKKFLNISTYEANHKTIENKLENLNTELKKFVTCSTYEANHRVLEVKVEGLQKMVYIGIGMLIVIQVLIGLVDRFIP